MCRLVMMLSGACAAALMLGACASTAGQPDSGRPLRVGLEADYPPIIYKEMGQLCGIEADLAEYVVEERGTPLEFIELPFDELIPSLERGEIDVIMSGLSETDARREKVRFVTPYMHVGQMALVRSADASRYPDAASLYATGLRAAVIRGSTGEEFVREAMTNAQAVACASGPECLAALQARTADIVISDGPFVLLAAKDTPGLEALPWLLTDELLAWAVAKGSKHDALYDELNGIVREARQRGDVQRIVGQYLEVIMRAK